MAVCEEEEEEEEPAVLLKTENQFQKWNDLITRTETCVKHYRLLLANSLARPLTFKSLQLLIWTLCERKISAVLLGRRYRLIWNETFHTMSKIIPYTWSRVILFTGSVIVTQTKQTKMKMIRINTDAFSHSWKFAHLWPNISPALCITLQLVPHN